ncbi:MAG: transposase [Anaerolineaceae bacterium]|nr:transposase [Anaerolineaceae bacterium]
MPHYRRSRIEGSAFFFTVVTYRRLPIFTTAESRALLRSAWMRVKARFPFTTIAIYLLPDHIHCIWTLPEGDTNYSLRWSEIKRQFSEAYLKKIGSGESRNESRLKQGEAVIWQRRFWEHTIRDLDDYHHHLDYIHFNPVKHGLVENVVDWAWSSFHRFVRLGYYECEWGANITQEINKMKCGE